MPLSILLVDDSKFVRMGISKELLSILEGKEVVFSEAANGNEALELICENTYDLIMLDLTMPEKTGYEVLESLQEKGIKQNIVVLTADIQLEAEKIVRNLGAIGYLRKARPFDREPFMQILKEINVL